MALHCPMRYPSLVTTSRVIYTSILTIFVISALSAIYVWNRNVYLLIMAVSTCISPLILTVSNITIYRIACRQQLQIAAQQRVMQSSKAAANENMIEVRKSAFNTFVFYIVMSSCYFPVMISLSIYSLSIENWAKAWNFADVAAILNSSIKLVLFCWRLQNLRAAVFKIGRKFLCKRTEEASPMSKQSRKQKQTGN